MLILNINGSLNENGSVMEEVHLTLCFGRHSESLRLSEEAYTPHPSCTTWVPSMELDRYDTTSMGRMFPLSPAEQKSLDALLREHLHIGSICMRKSPRGGPVFSINKTEGSLCLVQD